MVGIVLKELIKWVLWDYLGERKIEERK